MSTRTNICRFIVALIFSVMAVNVFADSPHYKKGPSCVANQLTVTCTGTLAGLGNGDVTVKLDFPDATGTTTCTNPGGKQAPGQNPATPADVSATKSLGDPKNGTLSFTVTTKTPENPTPDDAGCPNGNWTAAFDCISFGSGTLTILQDNVIVLGPDDVACPNCPSTSATCTF